MARPKFSPTAGQRETVAIAAGSGRMSHEEIAIALGISRNTLEKHFERELSIGGYQKRAEVIKAMQKAAKKGNVTAQRAYLDMTPYVAAPPAKEEPKPTLKPEKPKGKKEEAQAAAVTAQTGTEWADLLPSGPVQ